MDFRELSGLAVSGSGSFEASSLETEHLVMAISGSGDITIAGLVANELRTAISGSGKVTLEGEARSQSIAVSGSGRYRARELLTSEGSVGVSGSGVVELNATDHLEVGISGSGNSENVLRAIRLAKKQGAKTIGFTGYKGGKLAYLVDVNVLALDATMEMAEDVHLILDHVLCSTIRGIFKERYAS